MLRSPPSRIVPAACRSASFMGCCCLGLLSARMSKESGDSGVDRGTGHPPPPACCHTFSQWYTWFPKDPTCVIFSSTTTHWFRHQNPFPFPDHSSLAFLENPAFSRDSPSSPSPNPRRSFTCGAYPRGPRCASAAAAAAAAVLWVLDYRAFSSVVPFFVFSGFFLLYFCARR